MPGAADPSVQLRSSDAIRQWAAQRFAERAGRFTSRHYQSGVLLDRLTDAEAHVRVMLLATRQEVGAPQPIVNLTGVYHDVWRKTPMGWRLAHRAAHLDRDPGFSRSSDAHGYTPGPADSRSTPHP